MLKSTALTYRNAYSGLSRSTWLLSLVMLINRSGTMVVPFMTLYLTSPEMGYTIGQAGIVFGLFGFGAFTGAWCGGKLTDRFGHYPVQLVTLTGGGILFMILGQSQTYPTICLFTFLVSFVGEAFRPANSTAIAFYSNQENRTRSYALNRLAVNVGWALGSAIGGVLAKIDYELLFWVDGSTNISAAILLWFALKPVNQPADSTKKEEIEPAVSAYRDKTYLLFIAFTMVFAACFFQMFTNLPVFFREELRLSEPYIGFLMAINGVIIALLEMVLVYKLDGKRNNLVYISTGVAIAGVSFWLLNIPGPAMLIAFAMIICITIGEILSMPFMNAYWIGRSHPTNRGQYAGLYVMAWAAAQTLGPMGAAQLAEHAGFTVLWTTAGILAILSAGAFLAIRNRG